MIVFAEVASKEQVTAKHCDVFRHVAHRDVEISTLFHHSLVIKMENKPP